ENERAAQSQSELSLPAVRFRAIVGAGGEGRRVERRVAMIPVCQAIVTIRPRLCRHIDDTASGLAELRREVRGLDGELLDRIWREGHDGAPQTSAGVVRAIGKNRRAAGAPAVDVDVEAGRRYVLAQFGVFGPGHAADVTGG